MSQDSRQITIALLGLGTVGEGIYKVLQKQAPLMMQKLNTNIRIAKILVRTPAKHISKVSDPSILTDDYNVILNDPEIRIVVEVMGGIEPAYTYIRKAFEAGKSVVTANKDLIAAHGSELIEIAESNGCELRYEASVAGGIPIINPLLNSLAANEITEITGIVNGTTNFILTKMTREGMDYSQALAEATRLGYAEPDPTNDVEGYDAARKIAIMAQIAFHTKVTLANVYTEGITKVTARDISYAAALGWVIKLLGIARNTEDGVEVRVHPTLIPEEHPLASVTDSYNAIFVHGDAVGDVMFYGRGAGQLPTASSAVSDIFTIARHLASHASSVARDSVFRSLPVKAIDDTISSYYIRMIVEDRPGVLASVAGVFGNNSVSIQQIIQKSKISDEDSELVIITSPIHERHIQDAMEVLRTEPAIREIASIIRVYN
jgi:homoserine dehydrogenase